MSGPMLLRSACAPNAPITTPVAPSAAAIGPAGADFAAATATLAILPPEPERAHLFVQVRPLDPEQAGRARDVPAVLVELGANVLALDVVAELAQRQRARLGRQLDARQRLAARAT